MLEGAKFIHASITFTAVALVLLCDLRLLWRFFRPLSDEVYWQLQLTAKVIPWLVLGLWVSGGFLISAHLELDPDYYLNNAALQAKLILSMFLTFNGLLINRSTLTYIYPQMILADSSHRLWMGVQAVTSVSLWLSCTALGVLPNTQLGPFGLLGYYFLFWAIACLGVVVFSYYIPFFTIVLSALNKRTRSE